VQKTGKVFTKQDEVLDFIKLQKKARRQRVGAFE
jgi:hypothetical protein